jgi:hypothetical protein
MGTGWRDGAGVGVCYSGGIGAAGRVIWDLGLVARGVSGRTCQADILAGYGVVAIERGRPEGMHVSW